LFRANLIRLSALYVFGGVYADLDVVCLRPLDELLSSVAGDDWEVLISRDHPAHERDQWGGRSMWMNDFMIARPKSRFIEAALLQARRNLDSWSYSPFQKFADAAIMTGGGLLSAVVDNCLSGRERAQDSPAGLALGPSTARLLARMREAEAYDRIIFDKSWLQGTQVPSLEHDDEEEQNAGHPMSPGCGGTQ
jgi:hypothetical protein